MKKIVLVLLVLLLCFTPLVLTACSNVSQAQLLSTGYVCTQPGGYELFSYDVYYKTDVVGEMTLKFEPLTKASLTLPDITADSGEKNFDSFSGTHLTMRLTMDGVFNSDSIESHVLYSNDFTPLYSYKKTSIGGTEKIMEVTYSSKYAHTSLFVNGKEEATSRQKIKNATAFDNEMLYAIIRATKVDESSYSLSFVSPNALTSELDKISVSKISSVNAKIKALEPKEEETAAAESENEESAEKEEYTTPAYLFRVSTGNRYASTYNMAISKNAITVHNDVMDVSNVKKVILKITEGDYSYLLKDIEIA